MTSWSSRIMYVGTLASARCTLGSPARNVGVDLVAAAQPLLALVLGLAPRPSPSAPPCACPASSAGRAAGRGAWTRSSGNTSGGMSMRLFGVGFDVHVSGWRVEPVVSAVASGTNVGAGDLVGPAGVAPHDQVERGELAEREHVVGAVLAGELGGTLGEIEAAAGRECGLSTGRCRSATGTLVSSRRPRAPWPGRWSSGRRPGLRRMTSFDEDVLDRVRVAGSSGSTTPISSTATSISPSIISVSTSSA